MIKGAPFWDDPERYYIQTNNPTEEMLRKIFTNTKKYLKDHGVADQLLHDSGLTGWLESCGSVALTNCVAALGRDFSLGCPGGYKPQIDELVTSFLNDPRNYSRFLQVRPNLKPQGIPGNRVPQYFPVAAGAIFGIIGRYKEGLSFDQVMTEVAAGKPVQICLKSPSHYLAVVAGDDEVEELIYKDSWPNRLTDGLGGYNRRMNRVEFERNICNYMVVYSLT